jgi:hypothetical protein
MRGNVLWGVERREDHDPYDPQPVVRSSETKANPRVGSRPRACTPCAEQTGEVVRNHEVGTRRERWYLSGTEGLARDNPEWTHTVADGGAEDARAHREMDRAEPQERRSTIQRGSRARGESSGEELDERGSSSSTAARRGRRRGRGENLEDTSTPASGANPERERQGRGGSEQRPTSSRRPGSRETTDMTCWKPHDLDIRGNLMRAGLRTSFVLGRL